MERARLLELFDAYLDQRLSEPDAAALNETLRTSADARTLFWHYTQQHALLIELLAEARGRRLAEEEVCAEASLLPSGAGDSTGEPAPVSGRSEEALRTPAPTGNRLAWSRLLQGVTVLAASMLLALGLWFQPQGGSSSGTLPRLGELKGQVNILADIGLIPARAGQRLSPGQEIQTGDDSSAVVTYDDHSRLELNAGTAVRLLDGHTAASPGKRVFLVKGVVNATVSPQAAGRPLMFSTDEADLIAAGTRFSAAGLLGETPIELEEGKALLTRKGDARMIEMSTGTFAVAAPDQELYSPVTMVPASAAPFATYQDSAGPILALAPVQGGQRLAVGCANGQIRLWDVRSRKVARILDAGQSRVLSLAASPDGRSLAAGYEAGKQRKEPTLLVWDLSSDQPQLTFPCIHRVSATAFTPDAGSLALICQAGPQRGVLLWDLPDLRRSNATLEPRERLQLGARLDRVDCLTVSPDGLTLAAGYRDGKIRLWDTSTGRHRTLEGHRREVQALTFSPDGATLASGSRDGTVRLWALDSGAELRALTGPFNEVRCLTFAPDGQTLATGHAGIAHLWNVQTGEKRSTLKAHKFALTSLVYLDDGRTLATAGWDRSVKLWKLTPADGTRH